MENPCRLSNDKMSYIITIYHIDNIWVQINEDERTRKIYGYVRSKEDLSFVQKTFNMIKDWHTIN